MPNNLQLLNVTSITNKDCQKKQPNVVHDSHLCTQDPPGHGICTVCNASKIYFQFHLSRKILIQQF